MPAWLAKPVTGRHSGTPKRGDAKPARPVVAKLCRRCHEADAAKPKKFPQVVLAEHGGGEVCNACHQPHKPNL